MGVGLIPIKTPEGQAELSARTRRISQRHRTVLFLVDGKRDAEQVRAMALKAGVPDSCFSELIGLGMIMLSEPTFSLLIDDPVPAPGLLQVDVPLPGPDSVSAIPDSMLPPSRSLFPESASTDSTLGSASTAQAWLNADTNPPGGALDDPTFAEARLILVRAVRAQAPLAGTITLLKLRRARTRADLIGLLDEVESRISKPHRSLSATHTMRRVRQLLDGRADSMLESA
ncbi:MAG: hypothetical protein ABI702_14350 [Burkholderiales bacterium]